MGVITKSSIEKTAKYFSVSPAQIYSVASFYDQLTLEKDGKVLVEIRICDGANCVVKNAGKIIKEVESFFNQKVGDNFNNKIKIKRESCLGLCLSGPVMIVNGTVFEKVRSEMVDDILRGYLLVN